MNKITSQIFFFFLIIKDNIFASNTSKENTKTNIALIEIRKKGRPLRVRLELPSHRTLVTQSVRADCFF